MRKKRKSLYDITMTPVFVLLCLIMVYPFIYAFSYSISNGILVSQKDVVFLPRGFSMQNYELIFTDARTLNAFFISISRTVLGTLLFLIVTVGCAYSMSKQKLIGRKLLFVLFIIPMYFGGGLLPYYILIHDLGLMNNFLVYILPTSFAAFFMLIMKLHLENIPSSLEESAFLDGAGDFTIAFKIYLPLCKTAIVTLALFSGVSQWNAWFDTLLFVSNTKLYPLQMVLQNILSQLSMDTYTNSLLTGSKKAQFNTDTYKMAVLIVVTLPIVMIYPFAQKYFIKGMTLGAVK